MIRNAELTTFVILLSACSSGEQSLTLTASPRDLSADGVTVVELSAKVLFRGDEIPDGKDVAFHASQPVLFAERADAEPAVSGGRRQGTADVESESVGGRARAYLLAPLSAGEVVVEASYTTVNKDVLTDDVRFSVRAPPLVAAGRGTHAAMTTTFDFWCEQVNVGGLVEARDEIRVPCHLIFADATGRELPHTPVQFFAEAGHMQEEPATEDSPRRFTYVIPVTPGQLPRDVSPWPMELDLGLVEDSADARFLEHNPTDGLATILAVVRGHEAFDDRNSNGVWDANETFEEEGEPFLDVDDDGTFDANIDPTPCCDANSNGTVDGFNGRWDEEVYLGRMVHILWTGVADLNRSYILPNAWPIDALGNEDFSLFVVDRNFNPVAANDAADNVELDTSSSVLLDRDPLIPLGPTRGLFVNDRFNFFRFGLGDPVSNPIFGGLSCDGGVVCDDAGMLDGREWTFALTDHRTQLQVCNQAQDTWRVDATVTATIAVDHADGDFEPVPRVISATGTLADLLQTDTYCQ